MTPASTVERQAVTVVAMDQRRAWLAEAIAPGSQVVTRGQPVLEDGQSVSVIEGR